MDGLTDLACLPQLSTDKIADSKKLVIRVFKKYQRQVCKYNNGQIKDHLRIGINFSYTQNEYWFMSWIVEDVFY